MGYSIQAAGSPAVADTVEGDSVFDPAEDVVTLPTSRIYYTLTSYDWYARGEPLVDGTNDRIAALCRHGGHRPQG